MRKFSALGPSWPLLLLAKEWMKAEQELVDLAEQLLAQPTVPMMRDPWAWTPRGSDPRLLDPVGYKERLRAKDQDDDFED